MPEPEHLTAGTQLAGKSAPLMSPRRAMGMTGLSARGKAAAWAMTALVTVGMTAAAPAWATTSESAAGAARADASSGAPVWRSWYSSRATAVMWGVAAFSTKSIWAAGTIVRNQPLVVRWNG